MAFKRALLRSHCLDSVAEHMVPVHGLESERQMNSFLLAYIIWPSSRSPHVECLKEAPQENAQAQTQKAAQTSEILATQKLSAVNHRGGRRGRGEKSPYPS
jgi:hypothetical protein